MEILNNILIKNIRRFGENVDIEIGPGATIFYAPNGTGKTSVFEAIELALTGAVKRLNNNLNPLIRDTHHDSSVQLNFSSGKSCHVYLEHGGKPVLTGNHRELFGKTPAENVPYLLRLTHLLNQRGDGWFVQSESNAAGAQLDYLAIGREAAQASKVMISAKKAANSLNSSMQKELDEAKSNLNEWLELLDRRNSVIYLDPSRPLVAHNTIFETISLIANKYGIEKLTDSGDLQLIKSQRNEILLILERTRGEWLNKSVSLDTVQPMTEEYIKENSLLTAHRRTNASLLEVKRNIEFAINKLKLNLSGANNDINISNLKYQESLEKLERLQSAVDSEENLKDIHFQIETTKEQITDASNMHSNAKRVHSHALSIYNKYQAFFKREVALAEEKSTIIARINEIDQWRGYIKSINQLNLLKPDLVLIRDKDRESLITLSKQSNEHEISLAEAQKIFDSINAVNDSILAAVGIIVSELPPERGICPVCTESYEPSELRRRMDAALNAINPELQKASSRIEEIKNKLSRGDKNIALATSKQVKSSELLYNIDESIRNTRKDLSNLINRLFPSFSTPESADEHYKQVLEENEKSLKALIAERYQASPLPSVEELAVLKNEVDITATNLKNTQERLDSLQRALSKALDDSSDEISDVSWDKFNEVGKLVRDELATIESVKRTIGLISKEIEHQHVLLANINDELSFVNKQILNANTNISQYQAQWSALGLQKEPAQNLLLEARNALQNNISGIETDIQSLEQLEDEITRWQSFAEYLGVDEKIRAIHGRLSEADYRSTLADRVENLTNRLKLIQRNIETLNSLSSNLNSELDRVHEIINSINPLWNKLLKRIVIDPRFSTTKLDSYSRYRKQHADVSVMLHGEDISASHVASEAQITDLQLTFLLALAQNYEWMPWRALLLDDPTQHHDLVHASAVFDLLRDYIAEKDFQVLLATHDYVQAKFFMRKLQNDGIPARICTLQATSAGVVPVYKEY